MRLILVSVSAAVALAIPSGPVHACRADAPLEISDVKYADAVVVGRIRNYRIVRDIEFRRRMLANPHLSSDERRIYGGQTSLLSDYATFDIEVDEVLAGNAPARLSVTWDNSTFGEPEAMPAGRLLIALRRTNSPMPPLRGPSATTLPSPEPALLMVLQAPCSSPFIFGSTSKEAEAVRLLLEGRPR